MSVVLHEPPRRTSVPPPVSAMITLPWVARATSTLMPGATMLL